MKACIFYVKPIKRSAHGIFFETVEGMIIYKKNIIFDLHWTNPSNLFFKHLKSVRHASIHLTCNFN